MQSEMRRSKPSKLNYARKFRVAPGITTGAILDYLEALDCPRALTVAILFRNGEHAQLAELKVDPLHYRKVAQFRDAYAATKFLSKYSGLKTGLDLDEVAMLKFEKFELQCKRTNRLFRCLARHPGYSGPAVWLHNAITRKIASVLGDVDVEVIYSAANWGPGATTLIKRRDASSTMKFQNEIGITRDLYGLLPDMLLSEVYPRWAQRLWEAGYPAFQIGNKVITVAKDATENRVIAIEPGLNCWFQLGIGSAIRRRLKRVGIDLHDQSRNQQLALYGSKTGRVATVDFSSASDSIAVEAVRELFVHAPEWFRLMDASRSQFGQQGSGWRLWEKFSSMGNGFTFPLQSLVFYAIAVCCVEYLGLGSESSLVSVYGDDVIIPVQALALFHTMSEFYGFTMNVKKTHHASPFRESCGSHYMGGHDVKPFFLKEELTDCLSVYRLANGVRRLSRRGSNGLFCDDRFRKLFLSLKESVPRVLRYAITDSLGDGGFIENFDEARPVRAGTRPKTLQVEGYFVQHLVTVAKATESGEIGLLLARLRDLSWRELSNKVALRGRTELRETRSLVHQWNDLGPWA